MISLPVQVLLKHKSKITDMKIDYCVFKFLQRSVDGKLRCVFGETSVFMLLCQDSIQVQDLQGTVYQCYDHRKLESTESTEIFEIFEI